MKRFQKISGYLYDSSIDLKDRSFVVLVLCMLVAMLANSVFGLIADEPLLSYLIMLGSNFLFIVYAFLEIKFGKIGRARIIAALALVFAYMPAMFFLKGGIHNGTPIVLLVDSFVLLFLLDGKLRIVLSLLNFVILGSCWLFAYLNPGMVTVYSEEADWFYTFVQVILGGLVMVAIFAFQTRLYRTEAKLAEEKSRELEEMNRSQSRFFSSMSHEIRTPINTVLGLNEIILRQEDASEEIRKDAANIRGAGKMLLALINDILDVSKIEAGKMDIVPVEYSVGAMMSEIVNMIWLKAEEKGLEFFVDIDPGVPEVLFGDEVRIKQILINLLNNAVKYTKEGSISLHLECDIEDKETAMLAITVSDTGMGIRQEALPHLFDTFQRVDEEKNRHIEGTGLGLSIVKQLVELMDGEITVNSIYTQGSTFSVRVKQRIASEKKIGDLEISNMGTAGKGSHFEHSFHAPGTRILIVDDNEMNLQVEKKLLDGTQITIDLALSGEDALELTLTNRYDVIFMDHLMPEMDGIECFRRIREQKGGLSRQTPIIVLTANAGGENIELYNNTGFDGYLVKPVSGEQLESMLLTHLPEDKVVRHGGQEMSGGRKNTASRYRKKRAVAVTTSSMVDMPKSVLRDLGIQTLPFFITTDEGSFADGVEIDSDEMARYMLDENRMVTSLPSGPDEYVKFFSEQLKYAHHLIHITLSPKSSVEFSYVSEAIKAFDNVTVVNSGNITSATGMLVLIAARMAAQNEPVNKIVQELESVKSQMHCGFVISNTDYMTRRGIIPPGVNRFLKAFSLHPLLRVKNEKLGVGGILIGTQEIIFKKYIDRSLSKKAHPDPDLAFITYTGLDEEQLQWIGEEVRKRFSFRHIVYQKASAGITSNCGPGTFGILFMKKGEKSYHLGSLFEHNEELGGATETEKTGKIVSDGLSGKTSSPAASARTSRSAGEKPAAQEEIPEKWYEIIPGIDAAQGLKNSGSEDSFLMVLQIYQESGKDREEELAGFYEQEDWENYKIKIHALKSSSRLAGAMEIGAEAEKLEAAAANGDADYIREHHEPLMEEFRETLSVLQVKLAEEQKSTGEDDEDDGIWTPDEEDDGIWVPEEEDVAEEESAGEESAGDKRPLADKYLMEGVFEMLREGAETGNEGLMADSFAEIGSYRIPEEESELMEELRKSFESGAYSDMITLLDKRGNL